MVKGILIAATAASVAVAPVQAGCWKADEASAAGVRELQSLLMVAALRCQVAGHPMMDNYNAFVQANRTALGTINDKLKAHFIHAMGPVGGQRAYDAFTTSMANGYGAGASGADVCNAADSLAKEAALLAGSLDGLNVLVEREGLVAKLPEGLCASASNLTIAAASSTTETVRR